MDIEDRTVWAFLLDSPPICLSICREGRCIHVQYNPSTHQFAVVSSSGCNISSDSSSQSEQSQSSETEEEIEKPKHKPKAKQRKGIKQSKRALKEPSSSVPLNPASASETFEVPASLFFVSPPTEPPGFPQTVKVPASLMCLKEIKPTVLSLSHLKLT